MEINKNLNIPNKGLNQDISKEFQPEGTYPFALNAVPETELGEIGSLANEAGNKVCYSLTAGFYPIGQIPILDDKEVIFSVNPTDSISEIGIVQNCVYTVLISSACLAFNIKNQIRGIFRVREGCNSNIYFTDNLNPWRVIDIDNLSQYQDSLGNWDCNSFKLFRDYDQSNIDMQVFNTGGILNTGMYQFTYQYLDDDFNPQPWLTPSNPIPIYKDSLNEYTGLDGDVTGTVTNKSIQLTLSNLDDRYSYVRLGLIVSDFGTGFNSNAYILEEVPIEDNTINYLFQGIDPNKTQNTDLESFTFLPPAYYTGKDLNQIDNSLVLAYPKARDIDWIPFLQAALEIQSTYYIRDLFAEQTGQDSFGNRYPNSYYYNKSLMRDEVYAFGIIYDFDDGSESPAFHIPGRAPDKLHDGTTDIVPVDYDFIASPGYNVHSRPTCNSAANNQGDWDRALYNESDTRITPNIIDSSQLNASNQVERWKIFNTAIRTGWDTSTDNYVATGELAFFESQDYEYPDTVDCSGAFIYPDELRGQKIRYHKMPDATLEPHYWGYCDEIGGNPHPNGFAYIRPLSVKFDNINLPVVDGIAGYRIVRVQRNTYNSSVIDKGILYHNKVIRNNSNPNQKYVYQVGPYDENLENMDDGTLGVPTRSELESVQGDSDGFVKNTLLSFHSPLTKLLKDSVQGDFIKLERSLFDISQPTVYQNKEREDNTRVYYDELVDNYFCIGANDTYHLAVSARMNGSNIPVTADSPSINYTNRVINKQSYVRANEVLASDSLTYPFYNNCQNETFALELEDEVELSNYILSVLQTGLDNSFFLPVGNRPPESDIPGTPCVNPDDNTIDIEATGHYVGLKKYLPNQYNGIHQLTYSCPGTFDTATSYLYNNGDCFINDWGFKRWDDLSASTNILCATRMSIRSITRFWCESPINMELRDSEFIPEFHFDACVLSTTTKLHLPKAYYPEYYNETKGNVRDFLLPELAWDEERFGTVRNWYSYNKDFSIENTVRNFFPLPINHDFCNECSVKFPHRLANSNKSYQEERADNYRIFLPNNYRDIPGETGSINEIFIKDNKLFIHTTQSLWYQQVKPQQIKTDQATLYIGTGEFWEIPPNEIMTSLNGYAGCQHQVGTINTPFGYFYPSERERKVFLFNDKLTEISNLGLRNWFEKNLPLQLISQNPNLNIPSDNPANPSGVGFLVAYDKRHRRIIFSKKDFLVLDTETTTYSDATNNWVYRPDPEGAELQIINLGDITYFENKSWTISYQPDTNSWTSWHSYLPTFMYNNQNEYFTFSNQYLSSIDNYVGPTVAYIHNVEFDTTDNFQKFYTQTYPHIIELTAIQNPLVTNLFDTINYYNKVYSYDEVNEQWVEQPLTTFDELVVYNNNQSTPTLSTVLTNNTPFRSVQPITANQIFVTKAEQDWNISGFIDYTNNVNESVSTSDWTVTQPEYYIDKVVNPNKIDITQSPFGLQQFRSKYINYRLIANNPDNLKFVSKYNSTLTRTSDR